MVYIQGVLITLFTSTFFAVFNLILHKCLPKSPSEIDLETQLSEKDLDITQSKLFSNHSQKIGKKDHLDSLGVYHQYQFLDSCPGLYFLGFYAHSKEWCAI